MARAPSHYPDTPPQPGSQQTTDDGAYKRLFAEPDVVRDLLLRFITSGWSARLDLSTLEPLPTEHVGDKLKSRHNDVVWRVRFDAEAWLYLVLMIEFQRRNDTFMALRTGEYSAMLYRRIARLPEHKRRRRLPLVLPVVLYNGEAPWRAANSVAELIQPVKEPLLQSYLPTHRAYLLLDQVRLARQLGPELTDNLAELCVRFESAPDGASMLRLLRHARALFTAPAADSLRLAFTAWLRHSMARRYRIADNQPDGAPPSLELDDMSTVFEKNFDRIIRKNTQEVREATAADTRVQMLTRQLTTRFGPLSESTVARIRAGSEADHGRWAERLLSAPSLEAVFSEAPAATH